MDDPGLLPAGTPPCGHHPSWHSRDQAHPRNILYESWWTVSSHLSVGRNILPCKITMHLKPLQRAAYSCWMVSWTRAGIFSLVTFASIFRNHCREPRRADGQFPGPGKESIPRQPIPGCLHDGKLAWIAKRGQN
jgi:hypothetical protein